ncbi:PolA DNA polymerase I - 3'-5' exonuclease and polymerase domains [uncultured Caudovirales phage]|uniref:PolA DNA polymerase I - 3'-5' exonuclease and polymerase domains n=1 Tax=uncultured Caudovirales phage TaxID=2100421 RepID=A0A6J5MC83_9CAUD|nr:PolA DNA polymerase I - 3'-5' exonuclease and polymerase domains [uncultured Caudovirales phage]
MKLTIANEEYNVLYTPSPKPITDALERDKPNYITFDTETDGLHIKKARPFLCAVAWDNQVFVFPANKTILSELVNWSQQVKRVYAHNTTYDMHMMANVCGDDVPTKITNWGDTMGLCRLIFEAVSQSDGGDSLALKRISQKYIDVNADRYEKEVKSWLKAKESQDKKVLIAMLKGAGWSLSRLQKALDGAENVPCEIMDVYNEFNQNYPKPTYKDVPLPTMIPYLAVDVILTNILVRKAMPIVISKDQVSVAQREFRLIPVIYKMEREGLEVDRSYLQEAHYKMAQYIEDLKIRSHELAGQSFNVGQHAVIKEIYTDKLGERPESTDKQFLSKQAANGDELAKIIKTLRRLEKWQATYIEKILNDCEYDGRFYTQLNQYNPVTGRFSGDAQQFPKEAILDGNGNEIFNPRRAFKGRVYYLDYSQVELRVQAHYTMYFGGDLNLCRAYMPYKCYERDGKWYREEDNTEWTPTDVHSATTIKALDAMNIDYKTLSEKDFKRWRNIGKMFNFMRNYGGGDKKAAEVLDIELEQAKALNKGYTDAFPLVIEYQRAVERAFHEKGYAQNLYGRRYYLSDSWRFYKAANYIIQGSCADMLKDKMIQIDEFLTENNCKSRLILCVHDELQFSIPSEEDWIVPHIKEIMENAPNIQIPIVCEVEFTETYWSEKKGLV